jgi:NAD(P)-dependent dehydrogenase (short-subunit alcohol dehydrogenase family)/acyl carrier protein
LRATLASSSGVRADATYLITGGLGALGLDVARWIVEQGGRSIVLVGRRGASASSMVALRALEAKGATVRVVRADVVRSEDVARVMEEIRRELPPLGGIVHAAGVIDDGMLGQQTRERFDRVLAPKIAGTWNLHAATRDIPLDFFVLFASVAGVVGSAGQGNYAAANAFMDAFAHERRREGLPAISIDWGPWADGGMAAGVTETDRRRWAQAGIELMSSAVALGWFGELATASAAQAIVLPVRWRDFLANAGGWPFLAEMAANHVAPQADTDTGKPADLLRQLDAARPHRRRALLHAHVFELTRDVLGLQPPARFDIRQGFGELGMDSLMAVDLRNRLQRSIGRSLPSTMAFDRPTVAALVRYLSDDVLSLAAEDATASLDQPGAAAASGAVDVLSNVEDLSDEEVERLLDGRIGAGS